MMERAVRGQVMFRVWARAGWPTRLSVLVVLAAASLLACVAVQRREAIETARLRIGDLARLAAEQTDAAVQDAASLLQVLGGMPALRIGQIGNCHEMLGEIAEDHPQIEAISVVGADGHVACASHRRSASNTILPDENGPDENGPGDSVPGEHVARPAWFTQVMAAAPSTGHQIVFGPRIVLGPQSGPGDGGIGNTGDRPALMMATPLLAYGAAAELPDPGAPDFKAAHVESTAVEKRGVLAISLDVGTFAAAARRLAGPPHATRSETKGSAPGGSAPGGSAPAGSEPGVAKPEGSDIVPLLIDLQSGTVFASDADTGDISRPGHDGRTDRALLDDPLTHPLVAAVRAAVDTAIKSGSGSARAGVVEVPGPDGRVRLFGYARLTSIPLTNIALTGIAGETAPDPGSGLVGVIGMSRDAALRVANDRARAELAIVLVICGLACGVAWCLARSAVVMPLRRLAATSAVTSAWAGRSHFDTQAWARRADLPEFRGPPEFRGFRDMLVARAEKLKTCGAEVATARAAFAHAGAPHNGAPHNCDNHPFQRSSAAGSIDVVARRDAAVDGVTCHRTYVSQSSLEMLGYAPHELAGIAPMGGDARMIVHPVDWHRFTSVLDSLHDGRRHASLVCRAIRKDGTTIWVEGVVRRFGSGGIVVSLQDVARAHTGDRPLEPPAAFADRQPLHVKPASVTSAQVRSGHLEPGSARCDALTGLLDRRGFDAALGLEYRSAAELGTPLAVIMIDVDHFRSYNEAYGHAAGDACLQAIARIIGRQLRQSRDRAARYGGEEFAAILPATDEGHAMMVADAIRRAVERQTLVEGLNGPATRLGIMPCGAFAAGIVTAGITTAGTVTVSMGVAALVAGCDEGGPARLVELAAAALCEAKRRGRNVTQAASPLLR